MKLELVVGSHMILDKISILRGLKCIYLYNNPHVSISNKKSSLFSLYAYNSEQVYMNTLYKNNDRLYYEIDDFYGTMETNEKARVKAIIYMVGTTR